MITNIKVNNQATFDQHGIEINDLKKINFIYGANGSGKTTISNSLAVYSDIETCAVQWEHGQPMDILVYNKKFRDNSLNQDSIAGVFTLGKATQEEIEIIKEKERELSDIRGDVAQGKENLITRRETKAEKENKFKEKIWNSIYKECEKNFKEAFRGSLTKEKFRDTILLESVNNKSELLTFDKLKDKTNTILNEEPQNIQPFPTIYFDDVVNIEEQEIWRAKVVGKPDGDIDKLIRALNSDDWVNKGMQYLKNDEVCPFCQQKTISTDFKQKLENYFDKGFTEKIEQIKGHETKYESLTENLINQLETLEENEKNNKKSKLDIAHFSPNLKALVSCFNNNKILLDNKIKEPSKSIKLTPTKVQLDSIKKIIDNANDLIEEHNNIVDNFRNEKDHLIKCIWKYVTNKNADAIKEYKRIISDSSVGIKNLENEIQSKETKSSLLDNEIKQLTKNTTSVQPTIDSINKTLESFGFLTFSIVPLKDKENYHQIQRENGELENSTLSEGEITFITFLYFMQLAKGSLDEDKITNDRVLVVDDPISSLDSNVLFIVSTLLKGVIKNIKKGTGDIKQMMLLTHNVYFHKEVSFIGGRRGQNENKDTFYWILRQRDKISSIQCFEGKNPINTSYELLWQDLQDKEHNSNISVQNIMRRIIEHYFKILGHYRDDDLIQNFTNPEEQEICRSLLCWVSDGSHSISDDLFIESQEDVRDIYSVVFKKIFDLTHHAAHYKMMMGENTQ